MSIKRISAVWDQSTSKGNARLLMLALADSANDDGYCWPGYDHIQTKMACGSRGTICNAIEDRENAQELIVDHRPNQGNKYLVIVGFSPEQVKHGLSTYFGMDENEVEETYQALKERSSAKNQMGNKSKNRTNAISPKSVLNKSKNRTGTSLKTVLDPSLSVKEPSYSDPVGSDAKVEKAPHAKPERDALFDAIALHVFGAKPKTPAVQAAAGRVGKLVRWCLGGDLVVGQGEDKRTITGCALPVTPDYIARFAAVWKSKGNASVPRTPERFVEHFYSWLEQQQKLTRPLEPRQSDRELSARETLLGGG